MARALRRAHRAGARDHPVRARDGQLLDARAPRRRPRLCTALYCTVLYCTVLYCTVLHCTVLYCTVLYCTVLYCTVLYCSALHYCTALHCTALHCTALHCTALHYTVLYCTVLYCTVLYCTVLYYTILYYTILYYTILYYTIHPRRRRQQLGGPRSQEGAAEVPVPQAHRARSPAKAARFALPRPAPLLEPFGDGGRRSEHLSFHDRSLARCKRERKRCNMNAGYGPTR